jgi:nucleotide-binding universal stress UspA family protein
MKILIAYDGSHCADRALDDLSRAGLPQKAEAEVISVCERWLPPPSSYEIAQTLAGAEVAAGRAGEQTSRDVEAAYERAIQASRVVGSRFPDWAVSAHADCGSPASEIIKRAEECKADLIIVGAHGHSALGRFVLGSVSQSVVTEADCSVRVARGQASEKDSPIKIVIALDGSASSASAVRAVAGRNWAAGSAVRLVTSVDPRQSYATESRDEYEFVYAHRDSAEAVLRGAGIEVTALIKEEDAKRLIVDEAARWEADAIFVGARGLGRVGRLLLGSVSTAVVARAHCSVEVIRTRPARGQQ